MLLNSGEYYIDDNCCKYIRSSCPFISEIEDDISCSIDKYECICDNNDETLAHSSILPPCVPFLCKYLFDANHTECIETVLKLNDEFEADPDDDDTYLDSCVKTFKLVYPDNVNELMTEIIVYRSLNE